MAYTFFEDRYGSDFETEEDRRRREEEQKKLGETEVGSTTEKTYMDGSKTITQTREVPSQQAVLRPGQGGQFMRPVMRGPVNPDDFQRIQQIESGGRQFTPQGQVVTSPKGAMGISQIMPRTAMDPGYGVPNIFDLAQSRGIQVQNRDEATARQLLGNQELNTEFGRNYFNKMNQMYGPEAGAAAYNAGPGRVQQAIQRSQQTGTPFQQNLPQETQQYLQKFGQGRGPVSPEQLQQQQQQQQQPEQQSEMAAQPPSTGILGLPGVGASAEGTMGEREAQEQLPFVQAFEKNQNNLQFLTQMSQDPRTPRYAQNLASDRVVQMLSNAKNERQAKEEVQKYINEGNLSGLMEKTKETDDKGNWFTYIMAGVLGIKGLADREAIKLGLTPTRFERGTITDDKGNTKVVDIEMRADGKILRGIDLQGNQVSSQELNQAVSGVMPKGVHINKVENLIDPRTGERIQEQTLSDGKVRYLRGGKVFVGDTSQLENMAAFEKDQDAREAAANRSLQKYGAGATDQQKLAAYKQQGVHPRRIESLMGMTQGSLGTATTKGATDTTIDKQQQRVAAQTTTGGVNMSGGLEAEPVQQQGETNEAFKVRVKAWEKRQGLGVKQSEGVIKFVNETVVPDARTGQDGSNIVKKQFAILNNPQRSDALFGLYNKAQSNAASDKQWAAMRDVLLGRLDVKDTNLSQAWAQSNLNGDELAAFTEYNTYNGPLVAAMAKSIGGPQISNADREAAAKLQVDIATTPALGVYNLKAQQQFGFDLLRAKRDWAADKDFNTVAQLERAWEKEQSKLISDYQRVSEQRLQFIKKNSPSGKAVPTGVVREAYRLYPSPEYDPSLNNGMGGFRNLRKKSAEDILQGR